MKITIPILICLLLFSCSPRLLEPVSIGDLGVDNNSEPITRAMVLEDELNEDQIRHIYQTSNIITLMDHVMLKDSIYVMTLSEASMKDLKIKPEEINFAKKYVELLNKIARKTQNGDY